MNKIETTNQKSKGWRRFEFGLLCVCLCVLAIRGTQIETLDDAVTDTFGRLGSMSTSMVMTAVPVLTAVIWGMVSFSRKKLHYKFSGIEIGTVIFTIAGVWAACGASNKRDAINYAVTITVIFMMSAVMVQFMDSRRRVRLVLMVAVAAGVVNSYQCAMQHFISNEMMVAQYENNPESQLARMGIEPGSLNHALYLHRLESRDVQGFFTTGNSSAAFNIMAFLAAMVLLVSECRGKSEKQIKKRNIAIYALYVVWILGGIVLTHSKGGIGGAMLAAILFGVCVVCIRWMNKYCRAMVIVGIAVGVAGIAAIGLYGLKQGGLGGGNSMLVRWQYWESAMEIFKGNILNGIGGGNFGAWYTRYKIPAAIETVKDPHSFVLSLLCQYGVVGFIGFVAAFAIPMVRTAMNGLMSVELKAPLEEKGKWKHGAIGAMAAVAAMLFIRPIVMNEDFGTKADEILIGYVITYLFPAGVFGATMLFLWIAGKERSENEIQFSRGEIVLVMCGMVGVLIHNLIDFAIFEPGVLTMFMVLAACVCAMSNEGQQVKTFRLGRMGSIGGVAVCMAAAMVFGKFALVPVVRAGVARQEAMENYQEAPKLLTMAAGYDEYNPEHYEMCGKLYLQMFMRYGAKPEMLKSSTEMLQLAIERDPADFKNYEKIAQAYKLWAETLSHDENAGAMEKLQAAYDNLSKAIELYPGSGRLNYKLGEICEMMGKSEAKEYYAKAIEIEDAFRQMYMKMYPGRKLTSRLGQSLYLKAKEKVNN